MKTTTLLLNNKTRFVIFIVLMMLVGFTSCNDDDDDDDGMVSKVNYSGSFVKSNDNVTTSATGTATAAYDPATLELSYTATWSGLGSNAVNMHFHNDGPVLVGIEGFPNATSGTVSGKIMLTAQQATDLAAGKIYIQIHTEGYAGGEVIAPLSKSSNQNPSPNPGGDNDGY
jgi:hypothetical protein